MALKDTWKPKIDLVDEVMADDINSIADAVIDMEENGVNAEQVQSAVNDALENAKESGDFNGEDGKPYAYMLTVGEDGTLYCEYADTDTPPNFVYDEETGYVYYVTENSTRYEVLDVNIIVEKVLGQLPEGGATTFSLMSIDNEIGTKDLVITDESGQTILNMSFVRDDTDTATIMTISNIDGQSVDITIRDGKDGVDGQNGIDGKDGKDGQDYVLTDDDKNEIAESVKTLIPLGDYVKSVNGQLPNENGDVTISATIEPPTFAESLEWLEKYGETNKQYVLDGYLYAYMQQTIPAHKKPLFTNYFDIDNVLLNAFTTAEGVITPENYANSSYSNYNPTGFLEITQSIPFTPEMLEEEHTLRVVDLGYGIRARPNLIQPWIGEYHAGVSGVQMRDLRNSSGGTDGMYNETADGLGEQWIKIPPGVGSGNNDWREKSSINGATGSIDGIRVNLRARASEFGALTKANLVGRNIIITLDEEITYEDVPKETKGMWVKTDVKYGDDYSSEIEALEKRMDAVENQDNIVSLQHPFIKSINHRGYRGNGAIENTLKAYKDSKKAGFEYVETDVQFTSDNIPILYHNNIGSVTYEELIAQNPNLAKFEDFISLCRKLGLHPYIEIKTLGLSDDKLQTLYNICKKYGMHKNCTWISFFPEVLKNITKNIDDTVRIGYVVGSETISGDEGFVLQGMDYIDTAVSLKSNNNEVFINAQSTLVDDSMVNSCIESDLPLEVWTVNSLAMAENLSSYVSGFSSDSLLIGVEFLKQELSEEV